MLGQDSVAFATGDPNHGNQVLVAFSESNIQTFPRPFLNTLTVVPEPSTILLSIVGLGWAALHLGQKRRQRSRNLTAPFLSIAR